MARKKIKLNDITGDVLGAGVEGEGHVFIKDLHVEGDVSITRSETENQLSQGSPTTPKLPYNAGFQPIGNWNIQVNDAARSIMNLSVRPDGTFQCFQQGMGINIQGVGQWAFNPNNNMLQLQGLVNGFQPFMLNIIIQRQQNNGYYGVDSYGCGYFLMKA